MTRKFTFFILALFALIAGPGWGQNGEEAVYTLSITTNTSNNSYGALYDINVANIGWKAPGNQSLGNYIKIGGKLTSATDRYLYSKDAISNNINHVVVYHGSKDTQITVNSMTLYVYASASDAANNTNPITTLTTTYNDNSTSTFTKEGNTDWSNCFYRLVYNLSSSSSTKNYGIIFTKAEFFEESTPSATLNHIGIKTAPTKDVYTEGEYFDPTGLVITKYFDDETTSDLAYDGNETAFSFNPTLTTPLATTNEQVEITVGGKSANQAITVNAAPKYTITFMDRTSQVDLREINQGAAVGELPADPDDIGTYKFQGWAEQFEGTVQDAPAFVTSTTVPRSNMTYYAVYAEVSGSGESTTESSTIEAIAIANSWRNSLAYTTASFGNITVTGSGTGNNCKYYESDETWRFYTNGNGAVTITAPEYISNITLTGTITFSTPDGWNYSNDQYTPNSGTSSKTITINATGSAKIQSIRVTYVSAATYSNYTQNPVAKTLVSIEVSGTPAEFWKGDAFNHDGMTVMANWDDESQTDVTADCEFSTPDMATAGEKTVTVTYDTQSATYSITVKTIANTQETAYTVAEAKAIIDANPAELTTVNVYVKGTVSQVDSYNSTYNSITYWISEDGTTTNQFGVYSGKNLNNTDFASKDDVKVGDDVVVYGIIKKFNSTYEFDKNNYLVSHIKASTLTIDDITVEIGGTITPNITTNVPEYTIAYSVASEDVVKVQDGNLVTVAVGGPVEVTATLTAEGYKEATTTFEVEVIKALASITVKTAPTTTDYKEGDFFDPTGLVITASYSDASTGDIAYAGNEDNFTFVPSLETALTTDITSVTITYAGKETTQEISVRELYNYNITWMANGDAVTLTPAIVVEGSAIGELPTLTDTPEGFEFAGWTESESNIQFVTNTYAPTSNVTLYAVYSRVEGGTTGSGNYEKVTSALTDWRGDYLIAYSDDVFMDGSLAGGKEGVGAANSSVAPDDALSGNTITAEWGNEHYVTIEAINDNVLSNGYVIKSHSTEKPYFYQTGNENGMASTNNKATAAAYPISIVFNNENDIDIALGGNAEGAVLHYNNTETGKMFRFYKDGGQSPVYLYKKGEGIPGTPHYYTRVFQGHIVMDDITIEGPSIITAGSTLNMGTYTLTSENPANLIIEDGAQLIQNSEGVMATVLKDITGYSNAASRDGYYLVATPTATNANEEDEYDALDGCTTFDLYTFNPAAALEWVNIGSTSQKVTFERSKGYLYANAQDMALHFRGYLLPTNGTNGTTSINLVYYTGTEAGREFPGFNLIGNPYTCNAYVEDYNFYTMENGEFILNEGLATIAPCEGFFVEATTTGQSVSLSTEAPEAPASTLSLSVSQNRGNVIDRAIVNFNDNNNLHKFMMNPAHTNISLAKNGEEFAAVSTSSTSGEMPVNFKAAKNGTYTITVNTENVDAEYLHLIDNMTGMDIDLLASTSSASYTFEAKTSDYASRFKLVFGVNNADSESSDSNFAYMSDGNLVIDNIEGQATLQIVDELGRVISTETVSGSYNKALNLKAGLYILNLNGMTQKIVVK